MSSHTVRKCMQTIQRALWQLRSSDTFQPQSYTWTAIDGINTFSAWEPKMTHLTVPKWGKRITVVTTHILMKYTHTFNHWLCSSWNRKQNTSYYEWSAGVFNSGLSSEWLHSDCIFSKRLHNFVCFVKHSTDDPVLLMAIIHVSDIQMWRTISR